MRNKIAIFLLAAGCLVCGALRAQHYVGVRAGYGAGQVRIFPPEESGFVRGLYSGGVSWKYYSRERYVGGVEADVEFFQRAYLRKRVVGTTPEGEDLKETYRRYINSVMVPLIWQPHFYFFQRSMRVFLNAGLTFSYNINSRDELLDPDGNVIESGPYTMTLTRDNRFGYGLMGGAGLGFLIGRFEVMAEARYYFGYSDILKNRNKYETNPLRSPLDNINVSIGVYYRLGKGGILSAPSKSTAEKMRRRAERRAAAAESFDPEIQKLDPGATKQIEQMEDQGITPQEIPTPDEMDLE